MAVHYDETRKIFSLQTKNSTYQMQIDRFGVLVHLYYGSRMESPMDYLLTYADRGFSGNPYDAGTDRTYSLDVLPQEYPCHGTGDFRSVCLVMENPDGTLSCDLRYKAHRIDDGKSGTPGMPAVSGGSEDSQTVEIWLEDEASGLEVELLYGVIPDRDVITRSARLINKGKDSLIIQKASTACLDFLWGDYDLLRFYGRHAMERNLERTPISHGVTSIGSKRGASSHQYNPFLIVAERGTDEEKGRCYGMSFVYSGNFKGQAERDQYDQTRVILGLQDELFSYRLAPGEELWAPEVILSYSGEGLARLSQSFHKIIRHNLCRGRFKNSYRPVLVNNWEATYMDFDGEKICEIARQAADLGIEMLVLDDGWFGKRNSDTCSLGDWWVNEEKLGGTLAELVNRINGMGLKFGLWVEPEMISEDSELYRQHPDWAFVIPGRKPVRSRGQLALDFSRQEAADYVFDSLCRVLDSANVEYLKWDMNRSIIDVYSALEDSKSQGRVLYQYILGLYRFLDRLGRRYPHILIEGCCGGGGRFDAGMLYYAPQIWCSDNTDAVDRIRIQYGTSFGYPVSAVGAHVSTVPNHQTGRSVSFKTRGVVAMAGTFGYELDLGKLLPEEKEEVKEQVRAYKKYWRLIQDGDYYRLSDPFLPDGLGAWEFAAEDGSEALLNVVTLNTHGNPLTAYVRLRGLLPEEWYRAEETGQVYQGRALMEAGIPVPHMPDEYQAWQLHLTLCPRDNSMDA